MPDSIREIADDGVVRRQSLDELISEVVDVRAVELEASVVLGEHGFSDRRDGRPLIAA